MCYKFAEDKITWNEAQANCESENGHLATVNSRYVLLLVTFFNFYLIFVYLDYVFKEPSQTFSLFSLKPISTSVWWLMNKDFNHPCENKFL